ncbi:MAG: hypothetical protein EAZ15_01595 [Sphingobacteriales bacterium]|nr:MAG: hypothetical protein EAZ15_01595 [Sphingobacteriales bacterium]
MNNLQTQHPIALSLLINEDIYQLNTPILAIADDPLPALTVEKPAEVAPSIPPKAQPTAIPTLTQNIKPNYKYIGDNNKSVLILVNETDFDILNNADMLALNKLLAARKLEQKDVAILNIQKNTHLNFTQLKEFFGFNKLLLFGINPKNLEITGIVANQICNFEGVPILGTWHLKLMQLDEKKKLTFWAEFKKLI